ncbi:MAG: hypothetical protein RR283_13705 [Comamonas sp.]
MFLTRTAMLILLAAQTGLALLTISPDLTKQFDTLVNLAVVTNLVPYVLSMAALMTIQKVAGVAPRKALMVNIISWIAAAYSYLALYSSGTEALMLGGVATIFGFTLYGFVSTRMLRLDQERAAAAGKSA